ncbi:MAG: efflux RND transporter periplasmic adaptor subunit [bacterium]
MIKKIKKHKALSAIVVIVLIIIAFFIYKNMASSATQTTYYLEAVAKDSIVSTVSGAGQVSASSQVDIKPSVSGDLTKIFVTNNQEVKSGDLLIQLDNTDALKSVRDAQANLANAQLNLAKLKRGVLPEQLDSYKLQLGSANTSLTNAQNNLPIVTAKAQTDLQNLYDNSKNIIFDAYNKSNDSINRGLDGIMSNNGNSNAELSFLSADSQASTNASSEYLSALSALKNLKDIYNNYPTDQSGIDTAMLNSAKELNTVVQFFNSLRDALNLSIVTGSQTQDTLNGYKSSVSSMLTSANSSLTAITTQQKSIASQKITNSNNITTAQNQITSAQNSLAQAQNNYDLQTAPPDSITLQSQQISVSQAASSLANAQSKLADYSIKAPFDGIVTNLVSASGYSASNNTILASVITKQQIANITLNEIDAAKVKVGQKASLSFSAITDLEITGKVVQMDTIGTTAQGVVSYGAKIALDTQDERIKPGMSVSVSIITDSRINVLVVPSSAVKTSNGASYVQMLDNPVSADQATQGVVYAGTPKRQTVVIGLSDDTYTEIISGLNEGDQIITKTTTATKTTTSATAPSILQSVGGNRAGGATGGAVRATTGGGATRGN